MTILRSVVLFAFRRKMTPTDPMAGLRLKRPKPTVQPVWSPAEADETLANAPDTYRPYLTFLRETGCRAGEAKYMAWDDVDLHRGIAHIREKDNWRPKSGDQRVVPLPPRLIQLLGSLRRRGRWVFTAPNTSQYPEAVVRNWGGHVDPSILRLYTHISQATSTSYVEKFAGD